MSTRSAIVNSLATELKKINGTPPYNSNLFNNVFPKMLFIEDVTDSPTVCVYAGSETRQYLPAGFKWGFLEIRIRVYVNAEDPVEMLEGVLIDIEKRLDSNLRLEYATGKYTTDFRVLSISTDQGILAPIGVGDIVVICRYEVL